MKYAQLIFLNLLLIIGCSETEKIAEPSPPPPVVNPDPPSTEIDFSKAMDNRLVWDSTGEELIGKDSDLLYQTTVRYTLIKKINENQAIYATPDNKYVGIELYDNNKQAVMYKKGTVETWDTWEEVSFDSLNRLLSSAKGEWISSLQDMMIITLAGITYTVKSDGNLYNNNVLAFVFMNNPRKPSITRTPSDNLYRDRAVYKTYATDTYLGIYIKMHARSAVFYIKNQLDQTDMWNNTDDVSFDNIYAVDPTTEFVINAQGTYNAQDFYGGKFQQQSITINSPSGDIAIANSIRYQLEYVLNANQAVYKSLANHYIGVEVVETPKELKLYKKNSTENWTSVDEVTFTQQHYVDILVAYVNNLKAHSAYQLGDKMFNIQDNGDIHSVSGNTKTYTYVEHLIEGTIYLQTKLIYKTIDNKYVGIQHDPVNKTIDLYMQDGAYHERAMAWDNKSYVTKHVFNAENKVSPQGEWTSIRTGLLELNDVLIGNLSSTIDNDTFYLFYKNMSTINTGKGIVQQYNPNTSIWTTIGQPYFTKGQVNYPSIVADNSKNLYTVYSDTQVYVHKYNFATSAWIDYGNRNDLMTNTRNSIPALTINPQETLFLAYRNNSEKTIVEKRCKGVDKEWTKLGNTVFSDEDSFVADTAIAEHAGDVYVITAGRQDGNSYISRKVKVAKWNGLSWRELDSMGAGTGSVPDIKVNRAGIIYIAYRDEDRYTRINGGYPTVKKWSGDSWDIVGSDRWGDTVVGDITLDFYDDNTPVVLYGGSSGADTPTKAFAYNTELQEWIKIGHNQQVSDNSSKSYYTVGNIASDNTIFTAYGDPNLYSGSTTSLKAKKYSRIPIN